jgi:hypothetical protein
MTWKRVKQEKHHHGSLGMDYQKIVLALCPTAFLPHQRLVRPDCRVEVTDIVEEAEIVVDLQYDWRY